MKYDYVIIQKSFKGTKKTIEKIPSSYAYWDKVRQNDEKNNCRVEIEYKYSSSYGQTVMFKYQATNKVDKTTTIVKLR